MLDFLHHLFVPKESNNHRSKLLHHKSILFLIITLLAGQFFLSSIKSNFSNVLGTSTNIATERLLQLTNEKRAENGLEKVTLNDTLSQAALLKAKDMFEKNYWAHNAPDGTTPWVFFKATNYDYIYAGENLARGFTNSDDVVTAWMNSPSHRENMLSGNYKEIGFAIMDGRLIGEDTTLVVEMFGSRNMPNMAKNESNQVQQNQQFIPQAKVEVQEVTVALPTVLPTVLPTAVPIVKNEVPKANTSFVAAVKTQPLIDNRSLSMNIVFVIIFMFILALLIDMVIIERKKIVRMVGHNVDHVLFLSVILLFVILLTRGTIL